MGSLFINLLKLIVTNNLYTYTLLVSWALMRSVYNFVNLWLAL